MAMENTILVAMMMVVVQNLFLVAKAESTTKSPEAFRPYQWTYKQESPRTMGPPFYGQPGTNKPEGPKTAWPDFGRPGTNKPEGPKTAWPNFGQPGTNKPESPRTWGPFYGQQGTSKPESPKTAGPGSYKPTGQYPPQPYMPAGGSKAPQMGFGQAGTTKSGNAQSNKPEVHPLTHRQETFKPSMKPENRSVYEQTPYKQWPQPSTARPAYPYYSGNQTKQSIIG